MNGQRCGTYTQWILSAIKKNELAIGKVMNLEPVTQGKKVGKGKTTLEIHIHMESRKKWYINLFKGRNRDSNMDIRLVDTGLR